MNKKIGIVLFCVCIIFGMVGCSVSSSKSYTFSVETGDSIKVTLETSDDYDITSELPFVISDANGEASQGTFITANNYQSYVEAVKTDEKATILDTGEKDGNTYLFWMYNEKEYNYALLIKNSDTGILLGNTISEESAKACFQRLTVQKK